MTLVGEHVARVAGADSLGAWRLLLRDRHSCRDFDGRPVEEDLVIELLTDAIEAPNSCNHQNWHFVVVRDFEARQRCMRIASGNSHFETCGALVYLCFQMGWCHDKFSVVQGVAAAACNIILGAQIRGLASCWNAGVGDVGKLRDLLGVPPNFEIVGAISLGWPANSFKRAPKAPRRRVRDVCSFERFARPERSLYPAANPGAMQFASIANASNPHAVWNPDTWGWERISDFRGFAVWNKSPVPVVFEDAAFDALMAQVLARTAADHVGKDVMDFMGWGGGAALRLARGGRSERSLTIVEASANNLEFIQERLKAAGLARPVDTIDLVAHDFNLYALPKADVILAVHALEYCPDPYGVCRALLDRLRPGGRLAILIRNALSPRMALSYRRERRRQVSNRGPYRPLSARKLRAVLRGAGVVQEIAGFDANGEGGRSTPAPSGLRALFSEHVLFIAGPQPAFREADGGST